MRCTPAGRVIDNGRRPPRHPARPTSAIIAFCSRAFVSARSASSCCLLKGCLEAQGGPTPLQHGSRLSLRASESGREYADRKRPAWIAFHVAQIQHIESCSTICPVRRMFFASAISASSSRRSALPAHGVERFSARKRRRQPQHVLHAVQFRKMPGSSLIDHFGGLGVGRGNDVRGNRRCGDCSNGSFVGGPGLRLHTMRTQPVSEYQRSRESRTDHGSAQLQDLSSPRFTLRPRFHARITSGGRLSSPKIAGPLARSLGQRRRERQHGSFRQPTRSLADPLITDVPGRLRE